MSDEIRLGDDVYTVTTIEAHTFSLSLTGTGGRVLISGHTAKSPDVASSPASAGMTGDRATIRDDVYSITVADTHSFSMLVPVPSRHTGSNGTGRQPEDGRQDAAEDLSGTGKGVRGVALEPGRDIDAEQAEPQMDRAVAEGATNEGPTVEPNLLVLDNDALDDLQIEKHRVSGLEQLGDSRVGLPQNDSVDHDHPSSPAVANAAQPTPSVDGE